MRCAFSIYGRADASARIGRRIACRKGVLRLLFDCLRRVMHLPVRFAAPVFGHIRLHAPPRDNVLEEVAFQALCVESTLMASCESVGGSFAQTFSSASKPTISLFSLTTGNLRTLWASIMWITSSTS